MIKKRLSNIEFLKIIALLLITVQHVISSSSINFGISSNNLEIIIFNCFRYFGCIGNSIFVICSAFFLLDSKNSNKKKIIYIFADVFTISIIWLIPFIFININLSVKDYIKEFFPILFKTNWFVGCYIILYLVHPLLNTIINSLDKKTLLRINLVSFFVYFIIQFFIKNIFFFNELLYFILLYFITAYLKKYLKVFATKKTLNKAILLISLLLYFSTTVITNFLGLKYTIFCDKVLYWNYNMGNPFVLLISISMFNLFNERPFYNKTVNNISSVSLIYYVVHENILFRNYLRPLIYKNIFTLTNSNFLTSLILIFSIFILGILIAFIYKILLQKIVYKIASKIYYVFKEIYIRIEQRIFKFS